MKPKAREQATKQNRDTGKMLLIHINLKNSTRKVSQLPRPSIFSFPIKPWRRHSSITPDEKVFHTKYFSRHPIGAYKMNDDGKEVINHNQREGRKALLWLPLKCRMSACMGHFVPHPLPGSSLQNYSEMNTETGRCFWFTCKSVVSNTFV